MHEDRDLPMLLTAEEVAQLLRTSREVVYNMVSQHKLPGVTRVGRRLLFRRDNVLQWLRKCGVPRSWTWSHEQSDETRREGVPVCDNATRGKLPEAAYVRLSTVPGEGRLGVRHSVLLASGKPFREPRLVPVTCVTERQAHTWASQRKNALLALGEYAYTQQKEEREARVAVPTLRDFGPDYLKTCKANRQKPRTVKAKEKILEHYLYPGFGERKLNEFGESELDSLKAEFAQLNPKTLNNVFSVLNTVMATAKRLGRIKGVSVVAEHFDVPDIEDSPSDYYEPDVYGLVVSVAKSYDPRAYLVAILGGDAGLRRGEIVALEFADLDFRAGVIHVKRSESKGFVALPKGGRPRKVDMTDRLKNALLQFRHSQSPRVLWRDLANRREKDHPTVTEVSVRN
jgi:excisionase family DNA binding protein